MCSSDLDNYQSKYKSSPKGIKCDGQINIAGGELNITTSGAGGEGIESKTYLYVTDGTLEVYSYDDAINTTNNMYLQGGKIYARSTNNDAIDSNSSLFIEGGTIVAYSNKTPETALDVDSPGYIKITGGTVLAVGLNNMIVTPNSSSTQPSIYAYTSLSNTNYALTGPNGVVVAFKPEVYSSSSNFAPQYVGNASKVSAAGPGGPGGQGGSSSFCVIITSPNLAKGSSYTLYSGSTVSGTLWHGLYESPTVSSNGSKVGTVSSLSSPYSSINSSSSGGGWW